MSFCLRNITKNVFILNIIFFFLRNRLVLVYPNIFTLESRVLKKLEDMTKLLLYLALLYYSLTVSMV